jgi:hypothetical protein
METQNAIKLIKELKANKFLPKYNVRIRLVSFLALHNLMGAKFLTSTFRIKECRKCVRRSKESSLKSTR